jgi:hypothetical protein
VLLKSKVVHLAMNFVLFYQNFGISNPYEVSNEVLVERTEEILEVSGGN